MVNGEVGWVVVDAIDGRIDDEFSRVPRWIVAPLDVVVERQTGDVTSE